MRYNFNLKFNRNKTKVMRRGGRKYNNTINIKNKKIPDITNNGCSKKDRQQKQVALNQESLRAETKPTTI